MRILLKLRAPNSQTAIPFNYQYPLSAAIYKILSSSSPEYSDFLHNRGYIGHDGKLRKLFTFSRLLIKPRAHISANALKIDSQHEIALYISSPMIEDFIQHLVIGLFQNQRIDIAYTGTTTRLAVTSVEACPQPEFKNTMKFKCLSPVVVAAFIDIGKMPGKHYCRPDETEISRAISNSLVKKYATIHNKPSIQADVLFEPDWTGRWI